MRQYVTGLCLFVTTLIFLLAVCILSCSAKMTAYLNEKQESLIVSRGVESLDDAKHTIEADLNSKVRESSVEAYNSLTESLFNNGIDVSEAEAVELYRKTALQIIKGKYGMLGGTEDDSFFNLSQCIQDNLAEISSGELAIDENFKPYFVLEDDRIVLKNVAVSFKYEDKYSQRIVFDVSSKVSDITFYDENESLFKYCLAAEKGIYITGKTSTVIGNIYAGTHEPSELRKAEALYGESDEYGGLNIMSTQLAINADRIATDGFVNMKGAFVVFGSEESPVEICAKDIRQTDNVANPNIYALFGNLENADISLEKQMMREATKHFDILDHYYDSANDKSYTGPYRKIISSTDVTVNSDVTGIIMTPGSVIVEEGVNIEGLIISGDRIYIQGNNNIVSSVEVLRGILKEELYGNVYLDDNYSTIEEQSLNSLHLKMNDFLGGITYRGLKEN